MIPTISLQDRMRSMCAALRRTNLPVATLVPLLQAGADELDTMTELTSRASDCVQAAWQAMPEPVRSQFAENPDLRTEERLAAAVAWLARFAPVPRGRH